MGVPVAGQLLIFIQGDGANQPIRVQFGTQKLGIVDENGNFSQTLYNGIKFAFGQYGWDQTVHQVPQIFVDWLQPAGATKISLDAILANIDLPNSQQTIGAKVESL